LRGLARLASRVAGGVVGLLSRPDVVVVGFTAALVAVFWWSGGPWGGDCTHLFGLTIPAWVGIPLNALGYAIICVYAGLLLSRLLIEYVLRGADWVPGRLIIALLVGSLMATSLWGARLLARSERQDLLVRQARACLEQKDYDRAIALCTEALEIDPNRAHLYHIRGSAHLDKKDYDPAIADFTESIRLDPGDATNYHIRGLFR
jgi:tetratricopeptide (TPR) repeat protein